MSDTSKKYRPVSLEDKRSSNLRLQSTRNMSNKLSKEFPKARGKKWSWR